MRKFVFPAWTLVVAIALAVPAMGQRASKPASSARAPASTSSPASAGSPASKPAAAQALAAARRLSDANAKVVALFKAGKFEQAKQKLLAMTVEFPASDLVWYNLACAHARLGEKEQAFGALDTAVANGYVDFVHLQRDDDLESLRPLPAYRKLMARREDIQRRRADRILDELKKAYGQDYICEVVPRNRLVVATNIDRPTLDGLKERLMAQSEALWNDLFRHKFEQYVTVVVPKTDSAAMGAVGGYYMNTAHLLTAKTVGMTLHHEFTHALHFGDQEALGQQHPIWITEGLATLFESSDIRDGHMIPRPNHRLNALQALVARKKTIPWKDLMGSDPRSFMSRAAVAYSQVRYMMMYLYETGKLRAWYDRYTEAYKDDPTGVKAMEKTFGQPLAMTEADWLAWVKKTPAPPVSLPPNHAYIGVRVESETDGLEIADVVPGSGADKAGLKLKDLIVKIDGRDMVDGGDLIMLVDGHKAGDKLDVGFRRGQEYRTATVTLGPMPAPTRPSPRPRAGRTSSTRTSHPAGTRAASRTSAPASSRQAANGNGRSPTGRSSNHD